MHDLSPTVFRGQPDGQLRAHADWQHPLFFAESREVAQLYAQDTAPVACVLQGRRVLDLTAPDPRNAEHRAAVNALQARFEDWTCRHSGEPRDAWSFLEAGDLYHYSGCGDERWRTLFQVVLDELGYDAVRVLDVSEMRTRGGAIARIWVTQNPACVRRASPGEELVARLAQEPWSSTAQWLGHHPDLEDIPYRVIDLTSHGGSVQNRHGSPRWRMLTSPVLIWNGLNESIKPGDRVYAGHRGHGVNTGHAHDAIGRLTQVHPHDLVADDNGGWRYLPKAWSQPSVGLEDYLGTIPGVGLENYLRSIPPEQVRILADGERALIWRHREAISRIHAHCEREFAPHLANGCHGPSHWQRVSAHAGAVARHLGIDPLVPTLFGMVHDSQREDDGLDPSHGPRAATFVRERAADLFSFLTPAQIEDLAVACELHSDGVTEGSACQMAAWDGDRLDLWRVDVRPHPRYLCTEYAKRSDVIQAACEQIENSDEDGYDADASFARQTHSLHERHPQ